MNAKLTLYTQKELIEKVKLIAKENHTSVSSLVNNFLKSLVKEEYKQNITSKVTDELFGILKDEKLDEKSYKDYISKKYL